MLRAAAVAFPAAGLGIVDASQFGVGVGIGLAAEFRVGVGAGLATELGVGVRAAAGGCHLGSRTHAK